MITTIPFSGFYESWHSQELDRALENTISDSSGCHPVSQRIADDIWQHVEWGTTMANYAKEYAERFAFTIAREFGVTLTYESMSSPREYNFETDRLFCTISPADARKLRKQVNRATLAKLARERFTSRDGFISFYSSDVDGWGAVSGWDHNQLGTLIAAAVYQLEVDTARYDSIELSIIENMSCNGEVDNSLVFDKEGERLTQLAYYLRSREERQYRARRG